MDENQPDPATIRKYWVEVFKRAFKPVFSELAIRAVGVLFFLVLMVLIISGVLTLLGYASVPFFEERVEDFNSVLSTSLWTLAVMVVLVLAGIYRSAPEMYKEVGGFIEEPFAVIAHPPRQKESNENRWVSLDIINISPYFVDECFVTLDIALNVDDESVLDGHNRRPLLWSWAVGEENRKNRLKLHPKVPIVCDVAVAHPACNLVFFETHAGNDRLINGEYQVIVSVHGIWKNMPKSQHFELILEYAGGNVITIREKGKPRWQNPDPKPITKNLYPPVSNKSTS